MIRFSACVLALVMSAGAAVPAPAFQAVDGRATSAITQDFTHVYSVRGKIKLSGKRLDSGKWEQAAQFATQALGDGLPSHLKAAAYSNRCVAYSQLGQHDRAVADCRRAVSEAPDDERYIHNLRIAESRAGG